jgi:hypothetical protein
MTLYQRQEFNFLPIVLDLSSFEPSYSIAKWITAKVADSLQGSRKKRYSLAEQLLDARALLLVLDGFDEVRSSALPATFAKLSRLMREYGGPFVLTSRPSEYREALENSNYLPGAAAIEIVDLAIEKVEVYLRSTALKQNASGGIRTHWDSVLARLRDAEGDPEAATLRQVLTTPLTVSLARLAYSDPASHPAELLDLERFPNGDALRKYLLGRQVDIAASAFIAKDTGEVDAQKMRNFRRWIAWVAASATARGERDVAWWKYASPEVELAAARWCYFAAAVSSIAVPLLYDELDYWVSLIGMFSAFITGVGFSKMHAPRAIRAARRKNSFHKVRRTFFANWSLCLLLTAICLISMRN